MNRKPSPWLFVGVVLGLVVAVNLGLRELDKRTRSPGGPASSSYATAPDGVAAYAELLVRFGRPVTRLREAPEQAKLDPGATLVVLEPEALTLGDARKLRTFVRAGGRLVAGGDPTGWLGNVLDRPPPWRPVAASTAKAVAVTGVDVVRTAGAGAWAEPDGRVLVEAGDSPIVLEQRVGEGTALLVADPSPLQNRLLAEADNAALGLALAGDRPVAFLESVHGYGRATGVGAIPARWWWVFGGLCLAAVVLALARGRRLGPAELPDRELPPPRVEFAEALATQLANVRPPASATASARRVARARVARAVGVSVEASDPELRARAEEAGFDPAAVEAVLGVGSDREALLALGWALRSAERKEAIV